jgi:hypothetical protein
MPASHEAIGREIQWTGDGRGIDFHVSVGPSGASTISLHRDVRGARHPGGLTGTHPARTEGGPCRARPGDSPRCHERTEGENPT